MKKYILYLSTAIFALAFTLVSCGKDDDPAAQKSKEELVAQGSWKYQSATNNGNPFTGFLACQIDNVFDFDISGSGVINEGSAKCNVADPQTIPYTWSLINNKTEMQLSVALFTDGTTTLTLVSVTETQLVLTMGISGPGPAIQVQVTFVHA